MSFWAVAPHSHAVAARYNLELASTADDRPTVRAANQFLQSLNLLLLPRNHRALLSELLGLLFDQFLLVLECFLLLRDLRLLLFDGVNQHHADAIVLDALDLTVSVKNKAGIDFFDILGTKAKIPRPVRFPSKRDGFKTVYDVQARAETTDVFLVTKT